MPQIRLTHEQKALLDDYIHKERAIKTLTNRIFELREQQKETLDELMDQTSGEFPEESVYEFNGETLKLFVDVDDLDRISIEKIDKVI